jgi:hypothetical protein
VSDKTVTEREAVLRERAAFAEGASWQRYRGPSADVLASARLSLTEAEAAHTYPLPRVTRPRVVRDPHDDYGQEWRVVNGRLEFRPPYGQWGEAHKRTDAIYDGSCLFPTLERIRMWADLLANPTETVEDES